MSNEEVVTVRHYVETLLREYRDSHSREHVLLDRAIDKAERGISARLEGMNELRAQITSERGNYVTRDMLRPLQQFQDRAVGLAAGLLVLSALINALIVLLLRK